MSRKMIVKEVRSEVYVNSTQLLKAAELISDADPSIANGVVEERPGYLSQDEDNQVLILTVGIIPSTTYRINRRGKLEV